MRRSLGVGFVLLLAVLLLNPSGAEAQTTGRARPTVGQNFPNPFNPTTKIPLTLPPEMFEGGKSVTVSMRITNMLLQHVAVPMALDHVEGNVRVTNLKYYEPGTHIAYWDGTDRNGDKVGSGYYLLHVEVNGERLEPKRLVVTK
jgi:flagellar hook assembly protein FlgD